MDGNSRKITLMGTESKSTEQLKNNVSAIANKYENLEYKEFPDSLEERLISENILYERINLKSERFIYSDKAGMAIGEGNHYGIKIGDIIYDNMTPSGMRYSEGLSDLGIGEFLTRIESICS